MFWGFGKRKPGKKVNGPNSKQKEDLKNSSLLVQTVRGMKDVLPTEQKYWRHLKKVFNKNAEVNGYARIDTPLVESEKLFIKGTGETSDIVQKEMFYVGGKNMDSSEEKMVLRPEGTPGVARAYIQHGMRTWTQPVQLYYAGPMFRYDRPQAGRWRQFYQIGFESIGSADAAIDARLIAMGYNIFKELGLEKFISIKINTIGCSKCRENINEVLTNFYSRKKDLICSACQDRLEKNPLRLLDCKEKKCQAFFSEAPQIIDNVCAACKEHFTNVLEFLDEQEVPYDLDPRLVRGLDYYTRTTVEFVDATDERRQNTLGGGGRYDDLIEAYGGQSTPAIGIAFGAERIIDFLKKQNIKFEDEQKIEVFVVQLGEAGKKQAVQVLDQLQKEEIPTQAALSKNTIKSQLRIADKLKARFTVIIGQKEAVDKTAIIRDMKEGVQEVVDQEILLAKLKEKLKK